MMRAQSFIFLAVDVPHCTARRPLFLIEVHRLNQTLQQTQLVFAVEDLKVLRQVGIQMVRAQQTVRQPWKVPTHMPPRVVPISWPIR